ncbi:hypothetical protein AB0D08_02560 [Kitasatospora sp. NPDC048540]|uniref:hypothetical protein n=1 Tax=unclassified Kitasatospora TaxID=2633591 RepID=UPI00053B02F0|nr:hypothetical protein [Kitasatospora sp. MBT63]
MAETLMLGEVTCPSGELLVVDGGYLGLWRGDASPGAVDPDPELDHGPVVDLAVTGPDAEAAARSIDGEPGPVLYDVPVDEVADLTARFIAHCGAAGLDARLEELPDGVPHRDRARRCVARGGGSFSVSGVPFVALGGLPKDVALPVLATRAAYDGDGGDDDGGDWEEGDGWARFRVLVRDAPVARSVPLGVIGVDWARLAFADADALAAWQHDEPVDGLADVAFWGLHQDEAAAAFGAPRLGEPGEEDSYGWTGLPPAEALERAEALAEWKEANPRRGLAFDLRPHSHHWQVMRQVRGSATGSGAVRVGGAQVLFAMTGCGDGWFPAFADFDADGGLVAVRVELGDEDGPDGD